MGFGNLVVHLDPGSGSLDAVEAWLAALASRIPGPAPDRDRERPGGRRVVIPVTFDGPDLGPVATDLGVGPRAVVDALCGVGPARGLLGLRPGLPVPGRPPPRPRRRSPGVPHPGPRCPPARWRWPAGSPRSTRRPPRAGGRSSVAPPSLCSTGSNRPTPSSGPETPCASSKSATDPAAPGWEPGEPEVPRPLLRNRGPAFAEVVEPGLLSLVEDGGRRSTRRPRRAPGGAGRSRGHAAGQPPGGQSRRRGRGSRSPPSARRCASPVPRTWPWWRSTGMPWSSGSTAVPSPSGVVLPVAVGQEVTVGRIRAGLRAYLAVSGGFDLPLELGSRSSDVLCGLGPDPLRTGDRLDLGPPTRPHGRPRLPDRAPRGRRAPGGPGPARAPPTGSDPVPTAPVPGMDGRGGLQPGGHPTAPGRRRGTPSRGRSRIPSTGMVTGAVQVPPDGRPIILMPDHATVGGYPVACCVITADLPVLGQLGPGDTVSFTAVDPVAARRARRQWERALDERVSGWFPTAAGT